MVNDVASAPPLPPGAEITADGWIQILNRAQGPGRRGAVFLDRDGVVVEEVHYLRRPADVSIIAGAADVIAAANRRAVPVIMVTNQAGIGRGKLDWAAFLAVQEAIIDALGRDGAFVNAVLACPHHGEGRAPYDVPEHPWRKPNPGMLRTAAERLPIALAASWIVGDRADDIAAGRNAGLAGGVHVATGYGADDEQRTAALALGGGGFTVSPAETIADAVDLLPFGEIGAG